MHSNLENWKRMQEADYFEHHPCYKGLTDLGDDTGQITVFLPLTRDMNVVVIGCGYGREALHIARRTKHVFGIDVSDRILTKAARFLSENGVGNFTPVLAERYKEKIPPQIDLVFSVVVMQHLTRDLVRDYFRGLQGKLKPGGHFLVQFVEDFLAYDTDAQAIDYEPSINWTPRQILELSEGVGLDFLEVRSRKVTPTALWHWAFLRKPLV